MTSGPDLTEAELKRLLAGEEDEHVEFKESFLSRKEIGEYAVGIGNEGGGWLVMGVTNKKPRRIAGMAEPSAEDRQRLLDGVLDATGIRIGLNPFRMVGGFVLAVRIPGRPRGQIFHTKTGKFLMRAGEGLRGMSVGEIERIRAEELAAADYAAEGIPSDWRKVADPVELRRLRRVLEEHRREELARLGDEELLRAMELLHRRKGRLKATRALVLLLGTPEAIREHVPNHEVKIQRYDRDELTPTVNEDSRAPILALATRAAEIIEAANPVESFQSGLFRIDVPKFPPRSYREAIANALIHRDYRISGNVAVRVYQDRLEIASPGGWFGGVNERNILVTESQRRNELLASALQRIGLAERSALGVKRMFQAMLESGKEAPEYRSTSSSVTVVLRNGTFDRPFAGLARKCAEEGHLLPVFDLMLLAYLRRHREITTAEASVLCQQMPTATRRILDELRGRRLLDRHGERKGRKYVLGPAAYEGLGLTSQRPGDLGISERTFEGLLIDELRRRGTEGLTNRDIRTWSRYGKAQTTRLLKALSDKGAIVSSGKRGRGARYWLPEHAPKGNEARNGTG